MNQNRQFGGFLIFLAMLFLTIPIKDGIHSSATVANASSVWVILDSGNWFTLAWLLLALFTLGLIVRDAL